MSVPSPGPDGTNGGLPVGGTTGQVLTKDSNADFDADWQNAGGGGLPAGGSIGQLIVNTGPGAGTWQNAPPAAPLAHAPSHESGGSDPLTNLGMPFRVKDGADGFVDFTDDLVVPGAPVLTIDGFAVNSDTIILSANGPFIEMFDNSPALRLYLDGAGLYAGNGIARGDPTLEAFRLISDSGAGYLKMQDAAQVANFELAMGTDALNWIHADGSSLYADVGGLLVIGMDGQTHTEVGPGTVVVYAAGLPFGTAIHSLTQTEVSLNPPNSIDPTMPAARILSTDASLLLEHYDAAGTGTLLSSLVLAEPGSNALVWKDINENVTGALKDDGNGLSLWSSFILDPGTSMALTDQSLTFVAYSDQPHTVPISQATFAVGGASDWTLALGDTTGPFVTFATGSSSIYDSGAANHGLMIQTAGINTFGSIAVMGATPYGQDAYIDPTVITPEQLANYQIARGFMAAV